MPPLFLYAGPFAVFLVLVTLFAAIKILRQYERAVVFTLGKFEAVKGPGLVILIPFIQEMVRVDLRIQVVEIPTQDVISRDNVSMKVDAVLYFNVADPERAVIRVQDYLPATNMLAQTTLRAVLGQHELDEMLSERKKLSADVQAILDTQTEAWGIKVSNVEIRTVELTENMVRAIAKQAEAERDRRAKIIHAQAEFQASQTLVDAAQILSSIPAAMQLRYLQTLTEIGAEQNSTIVFPMPIDIIKPFLDLREQAGKARSHQRRGPYSADASTAAGHIGVTLSRSAAPSKPLAQTTKMSSTSNLSAAFNDFLFATVCEERNGMPLSVISVLARLDLDPWTEAAELSGMPADSATRRLSSLLDGVVNDPPAPPDSATIAARLVSLLPPPASTGVQSRGHLAALLSVPQRRAMGIVWLIFLASMVASLMMGNLAPGPSGSGPVPSTASHH